MRTSEIIIPKSWLFNTSNARSPEDTVRVSKPWLRKNESSKLR